jgi:hypothetical protein
LRALQLGAGYVLNKKDINWYAVDDKLGPGSHNDSSAMAGTSWSTRRHIGKNATNPALRYAGNDPPARTAT